MNVNIIFGDKVILMLNQENEEQNTEAVSMATTLDLKPPPPFDAEGGRTLERMARTF